jgi:hypothetical protein
MRIRRCFPIFAVALLLVTPIFAQRSRPMRFPGTAGAGFDPSALVPCTVLLNLSDAEKLQIQQILTAEQPTLDTLGSQLKTDQTALSTAAALGSSNACNIGTAYLKVQGDQEALASELQALKTKVEAVLTPDEKARLDGCLAALTNFGPRP